MREIRFRAWDNDEQKWFTEWENPHRSEWTPGDGHVELSITSGDGSVTLEQFTGLLDKNGKEIYEGDVLGEPIGLIVHWCTKSNGWQLKYPLSGGCACYHCEGDCELHDWAEDHIEVIGNIHENGDLLK